MTSGISAAVELCLTAAKGNGGAVGADVVLEPCGAAIAAGDGREIWQRLPNGRIASTEVSKCLSTDGTNVMLSVCGDADVWEAQGNGQLKSGSAKNLCLSQQGPAAGMEDV